MTNQIRISVRNMVEFIMRSGDLTTSSTGVKDTDAMQEGTRIHKKIQKQMGSLYRAEVPLTGEIPVSYDGLSFLISLEGRADGIFENEAGTVIDEIKGVYRDIAKMEAPVPVHRAQALCYAYLYASKENQPGMGIRLTYCHIPTEEVRYFEEYLTLESLEKEFMALVKEYAKWAAWQLRWQETRDQGIKPLEFPFAYREGQSKLVRGVYQSILRKKRLYIEAPTGVGKTISTVFPTVKSMGESLTEKIFYLTAKTITRTVAEETFSIIESQGAPLKRITLTAKEKICILDKPACDPHTCPRAAGHLDRVNDAVYDVLTHETSITRETVLSYAEKHMVCPFEMSLDISTWCDVIIGDYNYAFDPTASLKRFFAVQKENDFVFLVDEAHNLVDRAREMYSANLIKEDLLTAKKKVKLVSSRVKNALESANRAMLDLKRECDDIKEYDSLQIEPLVLRLMRLVTILDEFFQELEHEPQKLQAPFPSQEREELLTLYFNIRFFLTIYEMLDDHYTIYSDFDEEGRFYLHLQCMDPSNNLNEYLKNSRASIFFSATLLPIHYYQEQLASREDDYAIYAPSPFSEDNRLLMVGRGVSTKYSMRNKTMYQKIATYIRNFVSSKTGNYMVFFPSYRMLQDVSFYLEPLFNEDPDKEQVEIFSQENAMSEEDKETFLSHFSTKNNHTKIGLCVMGGIFGEGIDLKGNQLIGAVLVGTGLPMVCTEKELYKDYFDQMGKPGFSYAYQYPGMNKVLQAAGRVIRTTEDIGAILLLDDRFLQNDYQMLFPREWYPYEVVTLHSIKETATEFWEKHK